MARQTFGHAGSDLDEHARRQRRAAWRDPPRHDQLLLGLTIDGQDEPGSTAVASRLLSVGGPFQQKFLCAPKPGPSITIVNRVSE